MTLSTADLCDAHSHEAHFQIAEPIFQSFGAQRVFSGQITTLKVFEENVLVHIVLQEKGQQRVLVIDGGGSHRCALLDESLAKLAVVNGWQGLVINGCVRHASILATLPIGILALHAQPLKSHKKNHGDRDVTVTFAGVNFKKDHFLVADADGMVVSAHSLID
jgi:regulator of ribonuclease activity A